MSENFTNPAEEIYELANLFKNYGRGKPDKNQYNSLASLFEVDAGSPDYHMIISFITNRIFNVIDMMEKDDSIIPRAKSSGKKALNHLKEVVNPVHSGSPWNSLCERFITEANLISITMLSNDFYKKYPLNKLSESDKKKILAEMDEILNDFRGNIKMDPLLKKVVSKSFSDLKVIIDKIQFFGREVAEEKLIVVASTLQAAQHNLGEESAAASDLLQKSWRTLKNIRDILIVVGGVYSGGQVLIDGYGWVADKIIQINEVQRLITDQSENKNLIHDDSDTTIIDS